MKVFYTDPLSELDIETRLLGDLLTQSLAAPEKIEVLVVHQQIIDSNYLERFPALTGIVRLGVGYDKIDLNACQKKGIQVANIPDYCTAEVADTTLAMVLNLVRGLQELEARLRSAPELWQSHTLTRVRRSSELCLAVIGAGRIGSAVIQRAQAFGFACRYYDPQVAHCYGAERLASVELLISKADIVSLHVPLDQSTLGMVNAAFIEKMKTGSILINTARGKLIADENAVLQALKTGKLVGLGLDVLPVEPPEQQAIISAWLEDGPSCQGKIILSPHNGFYSQEAMLQLRYSAIEEVKRLLSGLPLRNPV